MISSDMVSQCCFTIKYLTTYIAWVALGIIRKNLKLIQNRFYCSFKVINCMYKDKIIFTIFLHFLVQIFNIVKINLTFLDQITNNICNIERETGLDPWRTQAWEVREKIERVEVPARA